jgi:hypothetical protein
MCKVRGNPRTNFVDALRLWIYLDYVCKRAGISKKGYQLEQHFEPEKITLRSAGIRQRSGKWDRLVALKTFPSEVTIQLIEKRYPRSRYYLEMPLWEALQPTSKSSKEWTQLYHRLRPALRDAALSLVSPEDNTVRIKHIRSKALDNILFEGDADALACTIALLRHAKACKAGAYVCRLIEWKINALLFGVLNYAPFYQQKHVIFKLFTQVVIGDDDGNFIFKPMWQFSDDELHIKFQVQNSIILMAEDIGLIRAIREEQYFAYLVRKSNMYAVYEELSQAKRVKKWQVKESRDGLKWIIHKLNQKRPPSNKISSVI